MNHYTLAEMVPGLSEEFTVTVTAEMMDQFKAITGDVSPIHIDADYAKDRGFPGRVVYGMLGGQLFLHPGGRLPARRALPAAWGRVQVCQAHLHRRYADRQGHRGACERDRQRG